MGVFKAGHSETPQEQGKHLVKRCPNCFINLPIETTRCYSCNTKVGKVDRHGKAKRKINWYSYLICIAAWAFLILYLKWAFF